MVVGGMMATNETNDEIHTRKLTGDETIDVCAGEQKPPGSARTPPGLRLYMHYIIIILYSKKKNCDDIIKVQRKIDEED